MKNKKVEYEYVGKLNLSDRTIVCLIKAGYTTIEQLHNSSASKLLKVRGLGRKGMKEILRALDEYYKTDEHIKKYYARDEDENVDEDYCYN